MVLLENFGAEPLTVQFNRPNCKNFVPLLPRNVVRTMMLRIPKFGKRVIPKGPRENEAQFFHTIFYGYSPGSLDLWVIRPATSLLDQDPARNFPGIDYCLSILIARPETSATVKMGARIPCGFL